MRGCVYVVSSLTLVLSLIPYVSSLDIKAEEGLGVSGAHKELTSYGFPVGLLPSSVRGYRIDESSGDFWVDLDGDCKITLPPDNYLATYSKTLKGKIVKGRIAELEGIRVRALFKWWSITGIKSTGEDLVFEVGVVTAKYPSNNFQHAPACEPSPSRASS